LHIYLFITLPPPPRSTLFPYTTLFRSLLQQQKQFVYWLTLNSHAPYDPRDIQKDLFPCEQFKIAAQSEVCRNFKIHAQFFEALADRKSTRLNSSHVKISYAVFCLKKKT